MKKNTPRNPEPRPAAEPKQRVHAPTTWRFTDWASI